MFADCHGELGLGCGVERSPAGQHFVQHRAEGEQVRAGVDLRAAQLLGRHVRQRPEKRAVLGLWVAGERAGGLAHAASECCSRARPKSSSFAPDRVSMMFAGLISRWTTPAA